ncbi:hypothetical protein ON010_g6307 [Phytophthora cinnamomi]|nr:hypothetical protein ON010_g6307 [Phytophthora cinnamomi]
MATASRRSRGQALEDRAAYNPEVERCIDGCGASAGVMRPGPLQPHTADPRGSRVGRSARVAARRKWTAMSQDRADVEAAR